MSVRSNPNFDRFIYRTNDFFESVYEVCTNVSNEFSAAEMFLQDAQMSYIDLPSARFIPWQTQVRNLFSNCLPVSCREFFLAERNHERHKLTRRYHDVIDFNAERLSSFTEFRDTLPFKLFSQFEDDTFREIYLKSSDEKKKRLSKYLTAYKVLPFDRFRYVYRLMLALCSSPPLDCELTVRVFRTMCDSDNRKIVALEKVSDVWMLEALICHAREMRFDFWGMWSGNGPLAYPFDFFPISYYIPMNQECRRFLLKNGFPYLVNSKEFRRRCRWLQELRFEGDNVVLTLDPLKQEAAVSGRTKLALMMDTFTIFGDFYPLEGMNQKVRTLVYLTRTLPDPYLTPSELYGTMRMVVEPLYIPNLQSIVHAYATADIFEHEYEERSPRRLRHLCRVAIRKRLAKSFKLPAGIKELFISQNLKRYLALEE